jgi:hypothetical protein
MTIGDGIVIVVGAASIMCITIVACGYMHNLCNALPPNIEELENPMHRQVCEI